MGDGATLGSGIRDGFPEEVIRRSRPEDECPGQSTSPAKALNENGLGELGAERRLGGPGTE